VNATSESNRTAGRTWWVAVGVGGATMAWGTWLFLDATPDWRRRVDFAKWLVGLALVHDLLLAPIVVAIGWIVARTVPGVGRAPTQSGLIASGCVLLVALLPLRGTANASNNTTIQPLDYSSATITVLVVVWTVVGVWTIARLVRRTHPVSPASADENPGTVMSRARPRSRARRASGVRRG
jgi:hypothetical protein